MRSVSPVASSAYQILFRFSPRVPATLAHRTLIGVVSPSSPDYANQPRPLGVIKTCGHYIITLDEAAELTGRSKAWLRQDWINKMRCITPRKLWKQLGVSDARTTADAWDEWDTPARSHPCTLDQYRTRINPPCSFGSPRRPRQQATQARTRTIGHRTHIRADRTPTTPRIAA